VNMGGFVLSCSGKLFPPNVLLFLVEINIKIEFKIEF
jgi:hypothetical protein